MAMKVTRRIIKKKTLQKPLMGSDTMLKLERNRREKNYFLISSKVLIEDYILNRALDTRI